MSNTPASASIEKLRSQLGDAASSLRYAPIDKLISKPQDHEPHAISLMLLFGHIGEHWTGKQQEVWVLFYPPSQEEGQAQIVFHSYDSIFNTRDWHDDRNISTTVTECAAAFKPPKKGSRSKHVALAKYYFLEKLAAAEERNGGNGELKFEIPIRKDFCDGLRVGCREFEDEAKGSLGTSARQSRSLSSTVVEEGDNDEGRSITVLKTRLQTRGQMSQEARPSVEAYAQGVPDIHAVTAHGDIIQTLTDIDSKETALNAAALNIDMELDAVEEARLKLELERQGLEEKRLKNKDEKLNVVANRKKLFAGMSVEAIFALGREMERSRGTKRRKLD